MKTHRFSKSLTVVSTALLMGALACSEEKPAESPGTGGTTATGGTTSSGGTPGSGGSSTATGGTSVGSGGASAPTGGTSGTGGVAATGGAPAGTGGTPSSTGGTTGDAGGGDASPSTDAPAAGGPFTFSSSGLVMTQNMGLVFPPKHSGPVNQSPPFTWSGAPDGTMSFAITLLDRNGGPHWAIWDIPGTEKGLAGNVPKGSNMPGPPAPAGSRQTTGNGGYFGPGAGPPNRTYEFRLWALKVAKLPVTGNPGAGMVRTMLVNDAMGAKQYVIEYKELLGRGTRGGIGQDP